jgi:hypothetical protein
MLILTVIVSLVTACRFSLVKRMQLVSNAYHGLALPPFKVLKTLKIEALLAGSAVASRKMSVEAFAILGFISL